MDGSPRKYALPLVTAILLWRTPVGMLWLLVAGAVVGILGV